MPLPRPILYYLSVAAAFLFLSLPHLASPRVGWEEAIVPSAAVELLAGHPISPHFIPLTIAGRNWPLLFNVRGTGAVESYMMLPIFRIFGVSVSTLRLSETFLTLLVGFLFIRAARVLFDEETAYTAAPLLLLNASFLLYGSRDGFEGAILTQWFFLALSLLAFAKVLQGRSEFLPWTALALGAGVYTKLHFLGIALGMSAAWTSLVLTGRCPAPGWRIASATAACFAIGCLPFVGWNIYSGGDSFQFANELSRTGSYPLVNRLGLRMLALRDYLCGVAWPVHAAVPGSGALALRAAPFAVLLASLPPLLNGRTRTLRPALLCLATIAAVFLLTISLMLNLPFRAALESFSGSQLLAMEQILTLPGRNHVLPIFPVILISYAAALRGLIPGRAARAVLVALLLLPDLSILRSFHNSMEGVRQPDAFEKLAHYLTLNGIDRLLNVNDHDLGPELEILTAGRTIPTQAVLFSDEAAEKNMAAAIKNSSSVFLVTRGRALSNPDKASLFERLLSRAGRRQRILRTFEDEEAGKILLLSTQ